MVIGLVGLADFAWQVVTVADADRTAQAARSLGIGIDSLRTRINLLVPLAAVIAAVALSVAYGAVVGDARRDGRIICATLLSIYTIVQVASGLLLDPRQFVLAAVFAALAAGALFFVRNANPVGQTRRKA